MSESILAMLITMNDGLMSALAKSIEIFDNMDDDTLKSDIDDLKSIYMSIRDSKLAIYDSIGVKDDQGYDA